MQFPLWHLRYFSRQFQYYIFLWKRIRFQKNARRSGIQSRARIFAREDDRRENGLEPVSGGTTSTKIFHESSEKEVEYRATWIAAVASPFAYISARFSIASAAKEICREIRGRRGRNLPDLAGARVKVTVTINVGFVCPRRHLDATHIDVKIQRRVKRLLMAYAGRTFCAIYVTFMLHIHISYLCGSALFTLIHYALLMYVNGKLSHLTSIKIANTLLHVLFYIFIMHAHYITFLRYKIFIIFLIVDLRQISILYKCFSYNFPRKDRLK